MYAPLTVGYMFTGKAYACTIRGHMLSASAILSLLLEEFWLNISPEEQTQLIEIYESLNPTLQQNDDVSSKLVQWFEKKREELTSQTSALWLNYTKYVEISQQFIRAERTNVWLSHVSATKQMINLFAATGHKNYAKTC